VPGMTIIDGIVRTQHTRNTAGEGAGDRGTAAIEYRACFISPDLRGGVIRAPPEPG